MNILAATTLSTHRTAYAKHRNAWGLQYIYNVQETDDNNYVFKVFAVTYPDETRDNLGNPCKAESPHFTKQFSFDELKTFFQERGWCIDKGWDPLELDAELP
jgi:hypothetical protein